MKIVIAPIGSDGDVRPMIAFGIAQRDKGHNVLICAPPNYSDICGRYGFDFVPVGVDVKKIMMENAAGIAGQQWKNDLLLYRYVKSEMAVQFDVLKKVSKDVDMIIGSGLQMAGQSVGEAYGIPYWHVLHTPQILESIKHPPPMITNHSLPIWLNRLFWNIYKNGLSIALGKTLNENRTRFGLPSVKDLHRYITQKIIISAYEGIAKVPDDVKVTSMQTSYWYLKEDMGLPEDLMEFMECGSKPIYVGFGSIPESRPESMRKIIENLIGELDIRLVISRGWADLGRGLESDRIIFTDFVPHDKLFPLMAAVVHHGGAGTTNTAAKAGVPQVIIPYVLDQYYHGDRVSRLKIGPRPINRLKLSSKRLISVVQEVLVNDEYSENAGKLGEILRKSPTVEDFEIESLLSY